MLLECEGSHLLTASLIIHSIII